MNLDYLLRHVSCDLHTLVRVLNKDGRITQTFCERPGFRDYLFEQAPDTEGFLALTGQLTDRMPLLVADGGGVSYGMCRYGADILLTGPFLVRGSSRIKRRIATQSTDTFWLYTLPECEPDIAGKYLVLLHNVLNDSAVTLDEFLYENCVDETTALTVREHFSDLLFEHRESGGRHNPYDQEVREQGAIRSGDLEQLKKSIGEDFDGSYGVLAADRLRSVKNLSIVVIALASRAAIEGGVLPEVSFTLSDSYINKIEELSSEETVFHLARQAEYHYAGMVHDILEQKRLSGHKKEYNPHIMKCKDYIEHHIHEKIYIRTVAKELNLHPNYLAELFLACEGCSMQDYICREKIGRAKNLLIYSDYSFIDIACYLGFSSQSHFGTHFSRITGYTPGKFRAKYGVKEFH